MSLMQTIISLVFIGSVISFGARIKKIKCLHELLQKIVDNSKDSHLSTHWGIKFDFFF